MPYLAWSDDLNTQIPELDAQHRVMIDRLNGLRTALSKGSTIEALTQMDALLECLQHHFEFEEQVLQMIDFSGIADHHSGHAAILEQVRAQRELLESDPVHAADAVLERITQALIEHIRHDDLDFGPTVREWLQDASPPDDPFRKLVGDTAHVCPPSTQ